MLNPIPELLMLSFFAPFFLRVALGLVLFLTSFHQIVDKREELTERFTSVWPKNGVAVLWVASVAEIVVGLMFVAGIYTQYAALVAVLFALFVIVYKKYRQATGRDVVFYILMLAISLSLLVTGAGIFAFDLPL